MRVGDLVRRIGTLLSRSEQLGIVVQVHREKFKKTKVTVCFPGRHVSGRQISTGNATSFEVISENKP